MHEQRANKGEPLQTVTTEKSVLIDTAQEVTAENSAANTSRTKTTETTKATETAERQAANAALALLAKAGNTYALGQLWESNRPLLRRMFWQWYTKNRAADAHGMTVEDFEQECYFAVQAAAARYDPEKGPFSAPLGYAVKNTLGKTMRGEHVRLCKGEDGKRRQVSGNPLNAAKSLDEPITNEDGDTGAARIDFVPDESAAQAFESVEERHYLQQLHNTLEECLGTIDAQKADVVRRRYYDGHTLAQISKDIGKNTERVRQLQNQGLRELRLGKSLQKLRQYREEIIHTRAYSGTGLGAWKQRGSIEESTIELLERRGVYEAELKRRIAEIEQRRAKALLDF